MKREKDLYDKIIDPGNLFCAFTHSSIGKKSRKGVIRVKENLKYKLSKLRSILSTQSYMPLPYFHKTLIDKCSYKVRDIYIPKFYPDQIVQWAVMLIIKPILMRGMYPYSCASIDGRGTKYALTYLKRWIKKDIVNTRYCLICDIRKFYASINQDILMTKFARIIKDKKTLDLISKIVRSLPSGMPIGNFTSQWFANFYLQDFDHFVKEKLKIKHYIRYMDDMVFFSSSKRDLSRKFVFIKDFLRGEGLSIKDDYKLFRLALKKGKGEPLDFLGFKFYRKYITFRSKTFLRIKRRIKRVYKKRHVNVRDAEAILSYGARIKYISGNKMYDKYLRPYINLKFCRVVVSKDAKKSARIKLLSALI